MFRAAIIRVDDSTVLDDVEVQARDSRRGTGDGLVWRGVFTIPPLKENLSMGETIHLRLNDQSQIAAVVTEIENSRVHFRARGRSPKLAS